MSPPILGLLGISATSIVNTLLSTFTSWIEDGAVDVVKGVGLVLDETTSVNFSSAFDGLYGSMRTIGGAFALPFLLAATVQAIVRQDAASLVRTLLVRAPIALLGPWIAIWLIEEGLGFTDALSAALLSDEGGSGAHFATNLASLLVGPGSVLSGSEGLLLAILTAIAAICLWIELIIRSSAVLCASLFIPLALAGVIWPVTAHWIRRLAETIGSLVLAKVAMVAVLVLGVDSLGASGGVSGVLEGVAILLLSSFAPFALLKLLPFIEQGATSHLEGLSRRALSASGMDSERLRHPFGGGGSDDDLAIERDPIPWMAGDDIDPEVFRQSYRDVLGELESYNGGSSETEAP